jgi:hypothetical protein
MPTAKKSPKSKSSATVKSSAKGKTPAKATAKAKPAAKAKSTAKAKATVKAKPATKAKPAAKKAPSKATKKAPASTRSSSGSLTSEQAVAKFAPLAQKLSAKEVLPCRLDVALALHNIQQGVASIEPHAARLRKEMSGLPLADVLALPDLALALLFTDEQVTEPTGKAQYKTDLSRLYELRLPMLLIAEGLAQLGIIPAKLVQEIRSGKGALDAAHDGVSLGKLYQSHATTLAGKHPFSSQQLDEIITLGERLTRQVTPEHARATGSRKPLSPSRDLRNRLYTLLVERHQDLRKAGYYLFGSSIDTYVPVLQARRPAAKPKKPASPKSPTPPQPAAP